MTAYYASGSSDQTLQFSTDTSYVMYVYMFIWLQQTKAKYEIEAEKRELARLLEKRTQEVENLTGKRLSPKTECRYTVH